MRCDTHIPHLLPQPHLTIRRQWPTVRLSSRWSFKSTKTAIASLPLAESLPRSRLSDLAQQLSLRRFQVFVKDGKLYAFKGIVSGHMWRGLDDVWACWACMRVVAVVVVHERNICGNGGAGDGCCYYRL